MSLVKLCGMFREEDIATINLVHPDYVGFIIDFPKSHRNVSVEQLRHLSALVDTGITRVGVFVNEPIAIVIRLLKEGVLDMAQLHGDEDDSYIREVQSATGKPVIKALLVSDEHFTDKIQTSPANFLLLDSGKGSGKAFDLSILPSISRPYFLAGGVNMENVENILNQVHPYCVDVSSGIETDKLKDPQKMKLITKLIRQHGQEGDLL